ncbi:MAG: hypothetical protein KAU95_03315 [Candidatus Aenigmarchaeota archaeon]|nr:hypothetical protein [Candidatus Aenigmarchaeota archaeon]
MIEEIELPRDFSFDTREGKIHPYKDSFDPTFKKRMDEKTEHRLNEHISKCFCIYEPSK